MDARRLFDEKLTNEEVNVLNKIATKSKMDCWFFIREISELKDVIYDVENSKELTLYEGIMMLDSGITSLDDYGLTQEEQCIYHQIITRLMAIRLERVEALLYNSLVMLEEEYGETVIGSDLEDEIGITQEEYDSIMDCPENKENL